MEALIHSPGVGWQQTSTDLAQILGDNHGAALGIFDSSTGALLCQALLPSFGPDGDQSWGWLAYVATAPEARRRGLATSLVSALLASGTGSPSVVGLYGSRAGVHMYETAGFRRCGTAQLVQRSAEIRPAVGSAAADGSVERSAACSSLQRLRPADVITSGVAELDARVYGADRSTTLARWAKSGMGWVLLDARGMARGRDSHGAQTRHVLSAQCTHWCMALCAVQAKGYVLGRAIFPSGLFLGPLVACDPADAEALLRAALDAAPNDAPVQMLLPQVWTSPAAPSANSDGAGWTWDGCFEASFVQGLVRRLGFERLGEPAQLMVRGSSAGVPWMRTWSQKEVSKGAARPFAATGYEFG